MERIGTFEITEQRLVDQARVVRTSQWLTEVELEEIMRKILTPRGGIENQEINEIPVMEERTQNESGSMEPSETEIHVLVETKITDEERLIVDDLKALMIRNETVENLPFKKVNQRKLRDVTKKVNAVIRHIETDDVTQRNKKTCHGSSPLGCKRSWSEERQNWKQKRAMVEKKN